MSFLKKVLGKIGISGNQEGDAGASQDPRYLKSRSGRIQVLPIHRVTLRLASMPGREFRLANLSLGGMAVIQEAGELKSGATLDGTLEISGKPLATRFEIVHSSEHTAGCKFTTPSLELSDAIRAHFELELAAVSLSPVNPSMLKEEPAGKPHWFLGNNNSELYFVESAGKIVHFYGSFQGYYFEGGQEKPTKFGHVYKDSEEEGNRSYARSNLVQRGKGVSEDVLASIQKFIRNVQPLDPGLSDQICQLLARGSSG